MSATAIRVGGERPYDVLVGTGITAQLPALVGARARTVVLIHADGLGSLAGPAADALAAAGHTVHSEPVPAGEAAKDISVAAALWSRLAAHRVSRSDAIIGLGGGAVTDLAGFVAATWLRGVRLVLVPTTLLAIVDAAVGGKTAINIAAGKNLVGAFHPPAGVLADLGEAGRREMLNYGHTLGHAIERAEDYAIPHGEAVAIGMMFAAAVGRLAGRLDEATAARHGEILRAVGLPTRYPGGSWPRLREAMAVDKKTRGRHLRFVVLDGLARPGILADPPEELLARAYQEV